MTALKRHEQPVDTAPEKGLLASRGIDLIGNAVLLAALWVLYSTVRGVTADEFTEAMRNAGEILRLQEALGLPSELAFQRSLLNRTGLLKAANIYYIAVHFPATLSFVGWVWIRHRDRYPRVRNTLIGVTAIGLALHVAYPLAPPRMTRGFVDTAAAFGPNLYDMSFSEAANQIAAMPSLHVGWALVVAFGTIWLFETRWRWLSLVHPAITLGVVVVTANHYWIDAIVAIILVATVWFLLGLTRHFEDRRARPATD